MSRFQVPSVHASVYVHPPVNTVHAAVTLVQRPTSNTCVVRSRVARVARRAVAGREVARGEAPSRPTCSARRAGGVTGSLKHARGLSRSVTQLCVHEMMHRIIPAAKVTPSATG
jgi:hypothetical protein